MRPLWYDGCTFFPEVALMLNHKQSLRDAGILLLGMLFVAVAVYYIMMPGGFVVGSLSGLVLVLCQFIPLKVSTLTLILNVGLLLIGFIFIGREFGGKTVVTSLILPVYLRIFEWITPEVSQFSGNLLLDVVSFVLVLSVGQAMLFNINASSGGLDIVAKLMNKYLRMGLGKAMALSGFLVASTSILVADREILVASLLGTYLGGIVLDHFIDGSHVRKSISIISAEYPRIQEFVVRQLNRGVTLYPGRGGWDNAERITMVTVLQKNEYRQLLDFIATVDPHAFVTVSTVSEVVGQWNPHRKHVKF